MPRQSPEARAAYDRDYYLRNRDVIRERSRRYYEENAEEVSARIAAYQRRNRTQVTERMRKWRRDNPEKWLPIARRKEAHRRARLAGSLVERVDPSFVYERDGGICGICGLAVDPRDWHLDHIIPIVRGGPHTYGNVQVSHPRCNSSKGGR